MFHVHATPSILVVDNFYQNPDAVRELALQQEFRAHPQYHKGKRTEQRFLFPGLREAFSRLIGRPIIRWEEHGANGVFQLCTAEDPLVYHSDLQSYAGAVYLNPEAPLEAGTAFYRSRATGLRRAPTPADAERAGKSLELLTHDTYHQKLLDRTAWDLVDQVGNVYNRLVLWDARLIHSAAGYFGMTPQTCRLFHLFFFDVGAPQDAPSPHFAEMSAGV